MQQNVSLANLGVLHT